MGKPAIKRRKRPASRSGATATEMDGAAETRASGARGGDAGDTRSKLESAADTTDVPFIGDRDNTDDFSDLRGRGSIDNPDIMLRGWTEQPESRFEATVGEWNTVPSALLEILARRRRAVARIMVPGDLVDHLDVRQKAGWSGTGFIVGDNLLLTNHHVLNSVEVARKAAIEFDYEVPVADLMAGKRDAKPAMKTFQLNPDRLFVTSRALGGGLDYSFVWIDEQAAREFGSIAMERASFTVSRNDPVFIVHHPRGRLKEVSLDDTEALRMRATVIHYAADTDQGSSGSPVFDRDGRLIALHHARNDEAPETLQDGRTVKTVNEGIKISAIALDLEKRVAEATPDAGMADAVLACMSGSDTLASFFGGLGRNRRRETDVEAVVDMYTGTEQDADIGFWTVEWLASPQPDQLMLARTATVIVDLSLDIWCLFDVSVESIALLVRELKQKYGEEYEQDISPPIAPQPGMCTAVIWKKRLVDGARIDWPAPVADWWKLAGSAELPFAPAGMPVFTARPALYRFSVRDRDAPLSPFAFNLVPLHLKAMAETVKQRRLAGLLLSRAVKRLAESGNVQDWLIGGDIDEELAAGDFTGMPSGFEAMSASDEGGGAFTYIKNRDSLIDNIFLPPNVVPATEGADDFVVARDKSVDKFVKQVSDHRPIVLRLSLADGNRADTMADADLRDAVERIVNSTR